MSFNVKKMVSGLKWIDNPYYLYSSGNTKNGPSTILLEGHLDGTVGCAMNYSITKVSLITSGVMY